MKVILAEDLKDIGKKGEEKEVKPGFARNYLFKNKLAYPAGSPEALRATSQKEIQDFQNKDESEKTKRIIAETKNMTLDFKMKASKEGKLFGSVSQKEITKRAEDELGLKVISIDPDNPVKTAGEHEYALRFKTGDQLPITVKISVES